MNSNSAIVRLDNSFTAFVARTGIRFQPGVPDDVIAERFREFGFEYGDSSVLARWFHLQNGLAPGQSPVDDFTPRRFEDLVEYLVDWRRMISELEDDFARDGLDVRQLDFWPNDGWFPLDVCDGPYFVDTWDERNPGRVIRSFDSDVEVHANSLAEFIDGLGRRAGPGVRALVM